MTTQFPDTEQEAIEYLIPKFDGIEKYAKGMSKKEFNIFCHSQISGGIGMKIRNELGLWTKKTEIYKNMIRFYGELPPDELSSILIDKIYEKIKHRL